MRLAAWKNARIVERDASNPNRFNLLLTDGARFESSTAFIEKAAERLIEGGAPGIHFDHGNALKDLGRSSEALESYDRALELKPDLAVAWCNRGLVLLELGRLDEAMAKARQYARDGVARSIGLLGNAAEVLPELVARGFTPDIVTDQTSAHDPLVGYVPDHLSLDDAARLRAADPAEYERRSIAAMGTHVAAMREMQKRGAIAFD